MLIRPFFLLVQWLAMLGHRVWLYSLARPRTTRPRAGRRGAPAVEPSIACGTRPIWRRPHLARIAIACDPASDEIHVIASHPPTPYRAHSPVSAMSCAQAARAPEVG